ncbi:hypothetical protein QAD02_006406 [Eretmocerus hayati]|uniref:Uncharacterized protein n=1 Tax=Eretmocerus hayati TaxID=131215 RepID=A0ACC2N346_9HYME|nr:hypothetical protein QAD02_006406 [Eretmocerus hayati]
MSKAKKTTKKVKSKKRLDESIEVRDISSELEGESDGLIFSWLSCNAATDTFKILLVFPKDDQQCEIIASVAKKLGWSVSIAKNAEDATDMFRLRSFDVAILDHRGSSRAQEADGICRTMIEINSTRTCTILALVKRSFFTAPGTEDVVILHLLNIGYNRAIMECSHEGILMNELIGIYANECHPKSQLAGSQILYQIVDKCRDIIHVTDNQDVIQFANRASERLLGYTRKELQGRKLQDFLTDISAQQLGQLLGQGRKFDAKLDCLRKYNAPISLRCQVIPMNVSASERTFYAYMYESSSAYDSIQVDTGRLSLNLSPDQRLTNSSTKRSRRSDVTDPQSSRYQSPVSKVIKVLTSAHQDAVVSCPDISVRLENAIEILKHIDVCSPRTHDDSQQSALHNPAVSDILGALMTIPVQEPQRSATSVSRQSHILKTLKTNGSRELKIFKTPKGPEELQNLLDTGFDWDFDIFKLEALTNRRPLFYLGMMLMDHYHVIERLNCDEETLQNWLTIMEANYNSSVSYHNSTHAADVLQGLARFMRSDRLKSILEPMDEVAALLAAIAHDIGHPGKSSLFLCNANDRLAILYNDLTVLEMHHSALTFKVTLSDDNVNIFKNLSREVYQAMRHNIIDMILATEMTKHFEHLAKFINVCSSRVHEVDIDSYTEDAVDTNVFLLPENLTMTKRMVIKCADVSNPTRPMRHYVEWTRRIAKEYFDQTDEEKRRGMPVVMPMFDRATCSIPKSQIGFVDYIINDMMEAWESFIDMPELVGNMRLNHTKWKEYNERGLMTLEDIEKLQEQPDMRPYGKGNYYT